MECPMCGLEFPIIIVEYHAWECNGREEADEGSLIQENTVPSAQAACSHDVQQADEGESAFSSETSEVPHPDTERCREKNEMPECPLCFRSIPADLIFEHVAFCNGPSCGKLPQQAIRDFTEPQERMTCDHSEPEGQGIGACSEPHKEVIPSCSQAVGSSVLTDHIMQVFHSYVRGKDAVVSRETTWSVEPKSRQEDNETSQNIRKALQCLGEVQRRLDNDPELNQALDPLLRCSRPLEILQILIKNIFGKAAGTSVTPFALFFYLSKMFLPRILETDSWTVLLKWLDVMIRDVVVPWISRMGGWGVVLALLGSLIAGGLLVGFTIKLLKPQKHPRASDA
ncbi:uncharacterized protein [Mobula birostris]|uniref:uncharacterized protein isoform X1 n=1 Tax=Mobula birostris TaxID=1983395 RepID=UPI003B28C3FF